MHVFRRQPVRTARRSLGEVAADLRCTNDWTWARDNYKATVVAISREYGLDSHLEVGGGRTTLFTPEEAAAHRLDVTINNLCPHELSLAPDRFAKLCCDIASPRTMALIRPERFDFVHSRMVMQHVRDVSQMWRNMHAMLADGGIALALYPTPWAATLAAKGVLPRRLSAALFARLGSDRHGASHDARLPPVYDRCSGDEARIAPLLRDIGFREVLVLPFYDDRASWTSPALRRIESAFKRTARERDWRRFTSFALTVAVK